MINERTEFLKGIVKIKQNYIDNIDKYEWSALLSDYIGSEVIDVALMEKEVLVIRKTNKESETYSKDMTLYKDIHKIYGDLKNKSLFLGNGIFETNTKGRTIKHPIITQQLSIMFDSLNGTFLLKPKKKPQLLTHIIPEKLNLEHLGEVIEMFGETNVLPCSAKAKELFVTMTNLLSADNDSYHISDAPILFYAENDIDNYINYINFLDHMKEQPSAVSTSPYSILMGTRVNTGSFINEHHTSELVDVYSLNKDQRKAAHDLMDNEMTVLLGPPGTGKTTTIGDAASLVAQAGDSVLITSKNSAAIEAVKDKLPDKIADISIFLDKDNDTRSVSKALDKVLDYYNKYSSSDIREKEVALERAIEELEKRIKDGIKCTNEEIKSEQKWIKVGEQLFENKETLDLVPDSTDNKFSIYDLEKLYQTNCISATEERLFKTNILENLKTPKELKQTLCKVDGSEKTLGELLKYFKLFIYDVWMAEAALEREDGPYHKLKFSIEKMLKEKKTFLDTFPNVHIEVNMKSLDAIKAELPKIHKAFSGKGKLTKLLHMKASVKECMESIIVDGEKMQNAFDCEAVKQYLIWKFAQENTATLWNKLIARHGLPEFKQVNERTILRTADLIAIAFEFFDHFDCLKEQLEVHGENWETFLCINDRYDPQSTVITKTIDAIGNLEAFVIDKENCLNRTKRKTEFSKAIEIASELIPYEKALGEMLIKALEDSSLEEYEKHYREVADLLEKKERRENCEKCKNNTEKRYHIYKSPK